MQDGGDALLTILTFNIWATGYGTEHRMKAVAELIEQLSPDVIGLQEVMWQSLDSFSRAPWWSSYACNINARKHRKATEVPGGLLLLLKRSTFSSISHYVFRGFPNTVMEPQRGILAAQAEAHGSRFCFVTTHLESPGGSGVGMERVRAFLDSTRAEQAAQSWELLGRTSREVFMFGDMNWIDEDQGCCPLPEGWRDPWWELMPPDEPGHTYDCQKNRMMGPRGIATRYRSRLDRVWYRTTREWVAEHVQIVGDQPIPGKFCLDRVSYGRRLPLFPSDHFALYARFRRT